MSPFEAIGVILVLEVIAILWYCRAVGKGSPG